MSHPFKLIHERVDGFSRQLTTGCIAQVLPDNTVHITFYRDVTRVKSENFLTDEDPASAISGAAIALRMDSPPVESVTSREDVFTAIIPFAAVGPLIETLTRLPSLISTMSKAGDEARSLAQRSVSSPLTEDSSSGTESKK